MPKFNKGFQVSLVNSEDISVCTDTGSLLLSISILPEFICSFTSLYRSLLSCLCLSVKLKNKPKYLNMKTRGNYQKYRCYSNKSLSSWHLLAQS